MSKRVSALQTLVLCFFHRHHCAPLPLVELKNLLAQAQGLGCDFDELVIGNEFDRLFQIQVAEGNQADRHIGSGRPHVGKLLLPHDVYVKVVILGVFADDHALVHIDGGADEQFATLLQIVKSVRSRDSGAVGHESASEPVRNFALPLDVAIEQGIHDDGATRVGEQLAAQANQSTAGDAKLDAYSSVTVIVHIDDFALADAELFHHYAHEFFGNVDGQLFDRFHQLAIDALGDDLGLSDHEFVAFAAHHFDENGKLEFAAAHDYERICAVRFFHAQGDVGQQFLDQALAQIARCNISALTSCERRGVDGEQHGNGRFVDGDVG